MTIVKRLDATVVSAIHDLNLAAIYCIVTALLH